MGLVNEPIREWQFVNARRGAGKHGRNRRPRSPEEVLQCQEVITGEGPTTRGRIHFSRTLDREDAVLCERILLAAGRSGAAVSRAEAEMLLDIDAAATERTDQGRFDDLLAKAVAHYVMAAAGRQIPSRDCCACP